ncbi:arabinan endo-1,5-alpha-L-arabinosidase [Nocardioides oleivorans]|uniref:Arabinan endo-1,5-alpha-L-arabinosidase n=1 Tax=Nocardioides oleivorans TaxID=273676 RepID=A0A4Q2RSL3_9ACTN|nr:family 43 glycosylhydrolase [Nocardioides oleivorans]RYB91738.1 arabinan endo-1,5-alpha-L-arabinosidase [Nocardioides oleivorans]
MRRLGTLVLALSALLLPALTVTAVTSAPGQAAERSTTRPAAGTYTNPVTAGTVDTFPDPATIRGHDGRWYAYGTTNPIFSSRGETGEHVLPMLRSDDLVHWTYAGDAIDVADQPAWWPAGTRAWAPDIRFLDGQYHLTYSLSTGGIGLLTSDAPTGPWTDDGLVLTASSGCPTGVIDQAVFTDDDGSHYLYWGSYDTICVARMNADATAVTGPVTQVGHGKRMEGAYVVARDGYYYLMYSDGSCCDGAFSGYQVKVARSTSPLGPFRTPSGGVLTDLTSHDGLVVGSSGNGWDGPGHNSVVTDLAGQDWLVYHGVPEADPDFPAVTGANGALLRLTKRPLLIDRLDWIDGWPVVNAGAGPSTGPRTAPVTSHLPGTTIGSATLDRGRRLSGRPVLGDVRVEGSLTGDGAGLVVGGATAWLRDGRLVVSSGLRRSTSALPDDFDPTTPHWVVAERRGRTLCVEVSSDRLHEPLATASLDRVLPVGRVGVASSGTRVTATAVGAARLHRPVTTRVADPTVGSLLPAYSDEFDGAGRPEAADPAWRWVRGASASPTLTGGSLVWPTQAGDLYGTDNRASVLLRDAPAGDFTVETKLTFDGNRGNQQAGLVLYDTNDRYLKLSHSVLPLSHTDRLLHSTEFLKEGPRPTYSLPTPVFDGPMFGGRTAGTMWLRLRSTRDAASGTYDVRMASSTDGRTWEWGGTWTLPVVDGRSLQIGLVSMNATGATASFDHVRTYG